MGAGEFTTLLQVMLPLLLPGVIAPLATMELIRRRGERLRGLTPG